MKLIATSKKSSASSEEEREERELAELTRMMKNVGTIAAKRKQQALKLFWNHVHEEIRAAAQS